MQNGMVMVPFKQKKKQTVIIIKNTKQKQTNKQTNKQTSSSVEKVKYISSGTVQTR